MVIKRKKVRPGVFERFAASVTAATGSTAAFLIAVTSIIIWAATGPVFHYSGNWQLVINTGTTIVTFLMVFLIQKTQNKDSMALQLKLNELIAAHESASNRMVSIEDITEDELKVLQKYYQRLSKSSMDAESITESHSIDAANRHHAIKNEKRRSGLKPAKKERGGK
jgi:low affinity Fe/Cu permease